MRISAKYTTDDWAALNFENGADWAKAIEMFHDRLKTRYLDHIEAIINRPTSGFAVLSLDCVLIETLQQFREGLEETPWGESKKLFVRFFTQKPFSDHFDPEKAKLFYTEIRNGLLHQAEAKGNSRVKRGDDKPLVAYTADNEGLVINVRAFHNMLKSAVEAYENELRRPESTDPRANFRAKMDYICRIEGKKEIVQLMA